MGMVGGGLGVGSIVIALIAYFLGVDPGAVGEHAEQAGGRIVRAARAAGRPADEMGQFVAKVLGSTEDVWGACSSNRAPVPRADAGPLRRAGALGVRHGAGGDGAVLLSRRREALHRPRVLPRPADALPRPGRFRPGLRDRARGRRTTCRTSPAASARWKRRAARASQAEQQPAVGAHGAAGRLLCRRLGAPRRHDEPARAGDVEEALAAATAIGDDRLQKQTQGRVVPESFTHGSSEQRMRWFRRGLDSGNPQSCDTFSAAAL